MKVNLWPSGLDFVHETPEDWRALAVICFACGRVYRHDPDDPWVREVKRLNGVPDDKFMAIQSWACSLCDGSYDEAAVAEGRRRVLKRIPEVAGRRCGLMGVQDGDASRAVRESS